MSTNLRATDASAPTIDGTGRADTLVCGRFNDRIVEQLERGARRALTDHGVDADAIATWWVPGALEVPQVAQADSGVGTIRRSGRARRSSRRHLPFRGGLRHDAAGLMRLSLDSDVVITNGILTVDDEAQALVRSGDDDGNKGAQAALATLETLTVIDSIG